MAGKHEDAIWTAEHIKLLASGVRQELVDTLGSLGGEAGASELALQLGRPMDGLYYHLELLRDGGLVRELPSSGTGERRFQLASRRGQPLRIAYRPDQPGVASALNKFAQQLLNIAAQDFAAGLDAPGVTMDGPERELWISRNKGWLSTADLAEVNALLLRLGELTSQPSSPERTHLSSLAFVLAPVRPRGKRRAAKPSDT